jgi:hypothetical protein
MGRAMISSTLDLSFAIGAFVLLPLIIWVNLHDRQSGVMAYLWRESPNLVRIGLLFLGLTWLAAAQELATYYGLLSQEAAQTLSIVLGVPMFLLSMTILVMAGMVIARYLRSRRRA